MTNRKSTKTGGRRSGKTIPPVEGQVESPILTESEVKQVWDFYQFARNLNNPMALTPMLLNQRMQDITFNPLAVDQSTLDAAIKDPKNSETELMQISEYFEMVSQPYKRLIAYLGNMLSFDLVMTPLNADKTDYGTVAFKKDQRLVESFLDGFDYQKEFRIAALEMLRNETFFSSPVYDKGKLVLQELPASPQYTKITGRWAYGMLFSLNMYWFLLPGVDINMYDPFFAKKYNELWGEESALSRYIPSISPELRGTSSWVYWQDIPPSVGWLFKMSPELAVRLPYFTGLYNDLILQPIMRSLQKNINMAEASKLLIGEVPYIKDANAKVADQISITPENLARFLQLVKSALSSAVTTAAAPLSNMKGVSFDGDNDLYPSYLKNLLATSGINTSLIFTSETRPNIMESHLSLNADEQLMTSLYPQFNAFLNYNANKLTKKFKWQFEFEGTNFFTNRDERQKEQQDLMNKGIVLPSKIAAAYGMKPQVFRRQMEEAKANGFVDMLTPIINPAQISGAGRPQKPDSQISDSGEQTKADGENIGRGGKEG